MCQTISCARTWRRCSPMAIEPRRGSLRTWLSSKSESCTPKTPVSRCLRTALGAWTKWEVQELIARRFPRPDVASSVRKLPARALPVPAPPPQSPPAQTAGVAAPLPQPANRPLASPRTGARVGAAKQPPNPNAQAASLRRRASVLFPALAQRGQQELTEREQMIAVRGLVVAGVAAHVEAFAVGA